MRVRATDDIPVARPPGRPLSGSAGSLRRWASSVTRTMATAWRFCPCGSILLCGATDTPTGGEPDRTPNADVPFMHGIRPRNPIGPLAGSLSDMRSSAKLIRFPRRCRERLVTLFDESVSPHMVIEVLRDMELSPRAVTRTWPLASWKTALPGESRRRAEP